jgi:PEP-CTERM motif
MKLCGFLTSAAVAAALLAPSVASAATFNLNFDNTQLPGNGCCGPFNVTAVVTAVPDNGNYDITGITGTITEGTSATTYNITGLITMPGTPPNTGLTPDTYFSIDNVMYVTTGGYSLSNAGIGFYSDAPSYYSNEPTGWSAFNLWGNGGASYTLATTASYDVNAMFNGTASITAVPEPSTWAMMLVGFAGLAYVGYRGRRSAIAVVR